MHYGYSRKANNMIKINHLTITQNKDLRDLISDLNMTIQDGEKVAIIGEEGNGKSTLLRALMGERLADFSIRGEIQSDLQSLAYIPQHLPEELKKKSLQDYFFLESADLDFSILYRLAEELHFDSDRFASNQEIGSLSGGEALKIQLIHELAKPFEILFLDEPSNDLDLETVDWLKGQIQKTRQTVIFISHDEDFLSQTADTIIHLRLVKHRKEAETLVEHLDYDRYSEQRRVNFARQSQQAANDQRSYDKTMEKHRQVKQRVETALRNTKDSTAGRLLAKKMKNVLSQEKRYEKAAQSMAQKPLEEEQIQLFFSDIEPLATSKVLVRLENETLSIGERVLAQELQLTVRGQDKIGIIGPNGVCKSTLLAKLHQLLSGKREISLGFMPQDYQETLNLDLSPVEFLNQTGHKEELQKIQSHLASLNFSYPEMHHQIHSLSGGQQGKLLLLNLVLRKPNFLLLDEPTRNFSPTSQPEIRKLFANYPGGLVTVSHDRRFLKEVCTNIYRLTEHSLEVVDLQDL
ncbi:ATP-binding cassette domain-containing protein [Streptococcus sp. DTU_2020_1001019_1_SI_AUS_MUR_006]|uniref:ATP-binding cassette domain-containing protein n=1 Tax=Streptococcus sp. DTU_2020_1001019_1_SI_AUS_MUR_006 TaxID=3077584 RepID=UPI0028F0F1CB|nr:ATP-binding cassette domain-containing protein [Streptococcus sp. DTU_2020_1001019_1_SI_AUS_MUR_006]WNS71586.1 ATP-binding cassette domain-containing protein [Streptococcus sp. DTU_2020_1001019_1_SI_AUS_MUR_006]